MDEVLVQLKEFSSNELPKLIIPIAILVVGFIIALIAGSLVRRGLQRTKIDDRVARRLLGPERANGIDTARWGGRVVYYVILLFTVIAFLQALNLTAATEPLNELLASLLAFVPNLLGAAVIALVAWMVASVVRTVLARALARWQVDKRVKREATEVDAGAPPPPEEEAEEEERAPTLAGAASEAAYWLVWLLFVPALLDALELHGLLVPVQELLNKALGFLPNIASAALILGVGWLVARVVRRLVTNALATAGTDRLSERVRLSKALGEQTLSSLIGLIVYIVILIPVAVGALNALQLEAVTVPASETLEQFFAAIPAIFGAALIVGVAYVAARLLYEMVHKLLNGIGFDRVLEKIGVTQEQLGERTPSQLVASLTMIAVLYFAVVEASQLLGFETFAGLAREFAVLAGHVLLGLVVFGFGLYLSRVAGDAIERSSVGQARVLSIATRAAILTLAGAMGLREMGIADNIIELAFGVVLGAIAIAAALAFGLGGRDAASRTIEELRERLHQEPSPTGGGGGGGASPHPASPEGRASATSEAPPLPGDAAEHQAVGDVVVDR